MVQSSLTVGTQADWAMRSARISTSCNLLVVDCLLFVLSCLRMAFIFLCLLSFSFAILLLDSWLNRRANSTKVYSHSVDPLKLRIGVKYYVVHSCIHQNHMRFLVCTRTACANCAKNARGYVCFAAIYFAFSFLVVKPIQSKQVEVRSSSACS